MIRYLKEEEKGLSRKLYEEAFPEDPKEFVDYYYSYCTKDNRILVLEQALEEEGRRKTKICSMLHLNPYVQRVNGREVPACYYVAVATEEFCRHQGMMSSLLRKSLQDLHREEHPYTYLMPANRAIYEPFDFRIVYEQKRLKLPMDAQKANEVLKDQFDIYTRWDDWYVEKLAEERRICGENSPFEIVPYIMMRITHVERMLGLLFSEKSLTVLLHVTDEIIEENQGDFLWEVSAKKSSCRKICEGISGKKSLGRSEKAEVQLEVTTGIAELTEFVFGKYQIPGLESVRTLKRICINESV